MDKVSVERLELMDLQGRPVLLKDYLQAYSLLIFLRHLA